MIEHRGLKSLEKHEIEGRHKGELVFVYGCGPSLNLAKPYAEELAKYVKIGVNATIKYMELDYYVFTDTNIWKWHGKRMVAKKTPVFMPDSMVLPFVTTLRTPQASYPPFTKFGRLNERINKDLLPKKWDDGFYWAASTNHASLCLASLFEPAEIAILGIDLNRHNHFFSDKPTDKPFKWGGNVVKDLMTSARILKKRGIKLWNCSPDSRVRDFDKIDIGELLKMEHKGKENGDGN